MRDTPSFVSPGEQGVVLLGLCGADFDTASVICELLNKIGVFEFSESGGTDTIVGSWLAKSFRLHPDSADIVKDIVGLSPAPCKISKVRKI